MSEIARREPPPEPDGNEWSRQHGAPDQHVGRWLLAVVMVVFLLGGAVGVAVWLERGPTGKTPLAEVTTSPPTLCPDATVRVVAAPEIAPVVQAAARTLAPAGAECGPVAVAAEEPDVTAAAAGKPDVWIPSSTAWLTIAGANGVAYVTKGDPLARSPILLAAPSAISGLYAKGDQTSWAALFDGAAKRKIPAMTMPDSLHSTVGLLSVFAVNEAMARTTTDAGIAQLRALTLRSRIDEASADPAKLMQQLAAETDTTAAVYDIGIFPVTEQQLTTYQHGGHPVLLTGAFPTDGQVEADYPFAVAKNAEHQALIDRLRSAITRAALTKAGFRTYATPSALRLPAKPDDLLGPALQWSQYRALNIQVLLLIDSSGSMNQQIKDRSGRTTTKAALLRASGVSAAQLLSEDTSVGLWFFGTPSPSSPAYVQAVPIGPMTGKIGSRLRRDVLTAKMASYKAPNSAGTPLYQSVLDGEAAMRAQAKDGTLSLVVVLTDGRDGESRFAMSQQAFLSKLAAQQDPRRPVPVIAVGYGPDADMNALTAMAKSTGGKVITAQNPADVASAVAQAFLAAHTPG
jgi:hypothetical protein